MKNAIDIIADYLASTRQPTAEDLLDCLRQDGFEVAPIPEALEGIAAVDALKVVAAKVNGKIREGYSGRGMMGSTCFGIVCDDVNACIAEAGRLGITGARRDTMGRDYIVYFPSITEDHEEAETAGQE